MSTPVFINFSNHPSSQWSIEQRMAAETFGQIVDEPFPAVSANLDEQNIACLADEIVSRIALKHPAAVLCQGEFTLAFAVTERLKANDVPVFAACSERETQEITNKYGETCKVSVFRFVRFRAY